MATFFKRAKSWEAQVRRSGLPTVSRRFHRKVDAEAWASIQEASITRGDFAGQKLLEQFCFDDVLARCAEEVTPRKKSWKTEAHQIRLIGGSAENLD